MLHTVKPSRAKPHSNPLTWRCDTVHQNLNTILRLCPSPLYTPTAKLQTNRQLESVHLAEALGGCGNGGRGDGSHGNGGHGNGACWFTIDTHTHVQGGSSLWWQLYAIRPENTCMSSHKRFNLPREWESEGHPQKCDTASPLTGYKCMPTCSVRYQLLSYVPWPNTVAIPVKGYLPPYSVTNTGIITGPLECLSVLECLTDHLTMYVPRIDSYITIPHVFSNSVHPFSEALSINGWGNNV